MTASLPFRARNHFAALDEIFIAWSTPTLRAAKPAGQGRLLERLVRTPNMEWIFTIGPELAFVSSQIKLQRATFDAKGYVKGYVATFERNTELRIRSRFN